MIVLVYICMYVHTSTWKYQRQETFEVFRAEQVMYTKNMAISAHHQRPTRIKLYISSCWDFLYSKGQMTHFYSEEWRNTYAPVVQKGSVWTCVLVMTYLFCVSAGQDFVLQDSTVYVGNHPESLDKTEAAGTEFSLLKMLKNYASDSWFASMAGCLVSHTVGPASWPVTVLA